MTEPLDRLESLFAAAIQKPAAERAAYLDQACGDDPALRRRVEELLHAQDAAGSFLHVSEPGLEVTFADARTERPGAAIGPYKLLQQIGEGGMGVVWMAEQSHPVHRKVALKVIKPGMDSRQVIARFEAERQALAMMDHVNIARVYDGGTTENGRPYFVMELVHGIPITRYCDENHLTPRQRLELFVPVCRAIQHAHQKGIIHRDIKPSNVMVTLYDGRPVPKVIDFGVAKATEQKLTERTLFTHYGTMVGTLEYMSPEQAEMSALGIDTRSDIYSLGVLLYELLTGSTPLSHKRLREAAFAEVLRIIKEEEPPKPSTRLSDSGVALAAISANRQTEPGKLTKLVRGELDWIVMKCLEKDRNRRYETASAVSMDVERYLVNEPVQACPPSPGYRLRKFVRRNKGPVLAASLLMLALVGGMIGTTWGLIRAEQQRRIVEKQRNELAKRNQSLHAAHEHKRILNERARQAIEALTSESAIEQLTRQKEFQPEQKEFLEKMLQYYAEATQETAATEPERSRAARTYDRMGRLNQILGRSQESENAFRRAAALYQNLAADFPDRPEHRQELALSQNRLGNLLSENARLEDAEKVYVDGLSVARRLAADFPAQPGYRQALAGFHNNLGNLLARDSGRLIEAEGAHAQALAIRKQLVADFPERPVLRRALAMSHSNLGWLLQTTGQLQEAEASFRDAVAAQRVAAEIPDRPEFRLELAKYQFNLGNLLRDRGRLKEAEEIYEEALPIEKQLAADFPNRRDFLQELAEGHNNVGHLLLQDAERRQEAEAAYREALTIKEQLVAEFPNIPDYRHALAGTLVDLAQAAIKGHDFAAARRLLDEASGYLEQALQANPRHPDYRQYYRNSLAALTQCCAAQGDRLGALAAATKQRDVGWDPAADAYAAARLLAGCVPLLETDETKTLDAAKRQAELDFYADQAMAMLRDAVARGFRDAAHMKNDENLAPLREREDFKKMVAGLEAASQPPPKT